MVLQCNFSETTFANEKISTGVETNSVSLTLCIPFTMVTVTDSANRTRDGLFLSLAFFAAVRRADFLVDC